MKRRSDAHTPGPWAVDPTGDIGSWTVGNSETEIANLAGSDVERKEMEANAHLIAAAPDLLKACRYADEMAEVLACFSGTTAEGRRAIKLGDELHARMRLSIAKAEVK